jgi:hypothetical protein
MKANFTNSTCDLCEGELRSGAHYYDASLPAYGGSWAKLCGICAANQRITLGTGKGQKYSSTTDEKVEG